MILIIVSLAMFMEAVDTTVLNTAIPVIAKSLYVPPIDLKLALISYLLSLAVFIPISGWIADKYGCKPVFIIAEVIFTLSSIWCGFSTSLSGIIIARLVQGLGGALTLPVGRLIIMRNFARHEIIHKMNVVIMVAAIGMMLGPMLGGIITTHISWRWIFWVNLPVGLFTIFFAWRLLPAMAPEPTLPLDKLGFLLFGSGLSTLTYALSTFSESSISHKQSFFTLFLAIGLLFFYGWHSRGRKNAIVKLELLEIRTFRVSVLANIFCRLGFSGIPFVLPLLLQISLGYTPQTAGFLLAPIALGVFIVKPASFYILQKLGHKRVLIINTTLVAFALWSFALINEHSSIFFITCLTFLYGFLIALQYTSMNSLAFANVSPSQLSASTSIMSTIQQLAQSFGVAVAAFLIRSFANGVNSHYLTLSVFHRVFSTMGILTIFSLTIFLQLHKKDGRELIDGPSMD